MSATTKVNLPDPTGVLDNYTVHRTPHGIYVRGSIPVSEMVTLSNGWSKDGFKLIDFTLCEALRATLVVVKDEAAGLAWRKELGLTADNPDWLKSGDTGTSSKTIYAVMTGRFDCLNPREGFGPGIPHDPDDFGRCYRLLKRFPDWRPRLHEVAAKYPDWKLLVEHWDQMTALYEEELPNDRAPKLYKLMQELQPRSTGQMIAEGVFGRTGGGGGGKNGGKNGGQTRVVIDAAAAKRLLFALKIKNPKKKAAKKTAKKGARK